MDSHRRKLLEEPPICGSCVKDCTPPFCAILCSNECASNDPYIIPPPSPPISSHHKHSTVLIVIMVIIGASFLSICIYGFYVRYYNNSSRSNSTSQPDHETRQEFLDEEHASTVKYRKGDGVVEGTECSVCLNEFQEDESLRLLPKCSHAFHIPCIDTWLRSHTNCPICRAPYVINLVIKNSLPEPSGVGSGSEEETETANLENNGENDMRMDRQDVTVKDLNKISTHETSSVNSSQNNFASSSSSNNGQRHSP